MDTKTLIAILILSVLSVILAITSMVLSYLRDKTRRQEAVWNAAVQKIIADTKWDDFNPYTTTASITHVLHLQFLYQAFGYIEAGDDDK